MISSAVLRHTKGLGSSFQCSAHNSIASLSASTLENAVAQAPRPEAGGLLRFIQTGRVQQYAALLFGAVALFGLALVIWV